jgi:hypothetical protein
MLFITAYECTNCDVVWGALRCDEGCELPIPRCPVCDRNVDVIGHNSTDFITGIAGWQLANADKPDRGLDELLREIRVAYKNEIMNSGEALFFLKTETKK